MAGPFTKTRINPSVVLRIYKTMKAEPLKVWVRKDFSAAFTKKKGWVLNNSMNLLIHLGLVEVVTAVYNSGRGMTARRRTKGFRLII